MASNIVHIIYNMAIHNTKLLNKTKQNKIHNVIVLKLQSIQFQNKVVIIYCELLKDLYQLLM